MAKQRTKYPPNISKHTYFMMHELRKMQDHLRDFGQHAKGMVWKDTDERDIVLAQLRDAYLKSRELEEMLRRASVLIDNRTQ